MKKILAILAAGLIAGCTDVEKVASDNAQNFLDAFLANDYDKAAMMCTDGFKEDFNKVVKDFRELDTNVRALLVNECQQYRAQINSVERVNTSDTFKVEYRIVKAAQDSLSVETEYIDSNLTLVGDKVSGLGE